MTLWTVSPSVPLSLSLSHDAATQSVSQPNPIKWLLMNFKQVLSPSSTCAMPPPPPPPGPTMRRMDHLIASPSLHPPFFCFFDVLKLLLSHTLNGWFFCLFPSLCSFVIPLSHLAYFTSSLSPTVFSLEKCCSLFTNFTHLHFLPHLSLMLVSHLFFPLLFFSHLFCLSSNVPLSFSLLCPSLPLSAPAPSSSFLTSSCFRQVIDALYLGSY